MFFIMHLKFLCLKLQKLKENIPRVICVMIWAINILSYGTKLGYDSVRKMYLHC